MPKKCRQAQLARELGVSRQGIHELIKRGILQVDEDGLIDVAAARAAIAASLHPGAKTVQAITPAAPGATAAAPETPATAPGPGPTTAPAQAPAAAPTVTSYHVAKTLREAAEARLAQLKLAQKQGEVIQVQAVRSVLASTFAAVREAMLQLPARVAPLLAVESDPAAIQTALYDEIHAALTALAAPEATLERALETDAETAA